jgi:hypothetical protein
MENMNGNILPGTENMAESQLTKKGVKMKYSALGVFLSIILTIVLILLGERLIFDLNRFINPVIDKQYTDWQNNKNNKGGYQSQYESPNTPVRSYAMGTESSGLASGTTIYYRSDQKDKYMMYKLIIHAAIILPLFLLAFVIYYFSRQNRLIKPLLVSVMVFAFWMILHLLGETVIFVTSEYKNIAIYIILLIMAMIFGSLTYYTQIKHSGESAL